MFRLLSDPIQNLLYQLKTELSLRHLSHRLCCANFVLSPGAWQSETFKVYINLVFRCFVKVNFGLGGLEIMRQPTTKLSTETFSF